MNIRMLQIKFLLPILFFFQLSCKVQKIKHNILEQDVLIVKIYDNFYLFPIKKFNDRLSIEDNLKTISINKGYLIWKTTNIQNDYLINSSTKFRRVNVSDDFNDFVKYINLTFQKVKYSYLKEVNQQLLEKYKKINSQKIKLKNNINFELKYDQLQVEIIKMKSLNTRSTIARIPR